ncbi:MAG: hypothetical protein K9M17_08065 [Mariprofundaceae bacterium]|nr:hypothetical protein [Mariprofundaceae bacterium]
MTQKVILPVLAGSGKLIIGRQLVEAVAARRRIAFIDITEAVEEMTTFLSECVHD